MGDADVAVNAEPPRSISILGSTGSVGCQTIDLLVRNRANYVVESLTANRNVEALAEQARLLRPKFVAIGDIECYSTLKEALAQTGIEVAAGPEALVEAAERSANWVMAAIVGAAGLAPTLAAVRRGAMVALANKECLVCAGELFMSEVETGEAVLLPVDSEHNAIYQVFDFDRIDAVERLILTASGGPFREWSREDMAGVTPAQAVAHPNWDMGAKISVDSATMMNKGLEVIEAHHIFQMPEDRLDVLVHPQSVVHSMVSYSDGSVLAQLGTPDMRIPIGYTLAWPDRMATPSERLDLASIGSLEFETPDPQRFPALALAREALKAGGSAPTVLNAANEVAVAHFLEGRIGFLEIASVAEETLGNYEMGSMATLDDVIRVDDFARRKATEISASIDR